MSTERRLLGYMKPFWPLFAGSLLASLLASVLDGLNLILLIPLLRTLFGTAGALEGQTPTNLETFIRWITDPLIGDADPLMAAVRILALFLGVLLFKNLMSYLAAYSRVVISEGFARNLRNALFDHILRLHLSYFQVTRQGQLVAALIADVEDAKGVVSSSLARLFQNAFLIVVSLVALTQISLRLTLLTIATAPILVVGIGTLLRRLRFHARLRVGERGDLTSTVAERVSAIKLIRAYGEEDRESRGFHDQSARFAKRVIRTQRFLLVMSPVSEIFGGLVLVLLILAGTRPELIGVSLSPEVVVVFLVAALRMMSPIKSVAQFPAEMGMAMASAERVFQVLDEPATDVDQPGERDAAFRQDLRYEDVTFAYGDDPPVLRDISFRAPRGTVTAIVGPSGAGKTTLVDLLPRFHDPQGGAILLDGIPLTELKRSSIRSLLGVVSQDTVLLNDTVHANILIGDQTASREAVERAARAANAHEFIIQLPEGYETPLGERGTRLSGGQRQRVAIARALLRDPPILILDEATSALDPESELQVQEAIDRLMQHRTVLVIAHRLSTVQHADEILVLVDGCLVERGNHMTLYRQGGVYRRLHDIQFREPGEVVESEAVSVTNEAHPGE